MKRFWLFSLLSCKHSLTDTRSSPYCAFLYISSQCNCIAPVSRRIAPVSRRIASVSRCVAPVSRRIAPVSRRIAPVSRRIAPVLRLYRVVLQPCMRVH